jgi:NADPH:quinone reductase-like Zn-dependent oxidoreductase
MAVRQAHLASHVNRQVHPTGAEIRAVRIHRSGPPEVLVVDTVPRPAAGPGDLLVQVAATGVDPPDWKIRSGGGVRVALPFVLGGDVVTS